MTLRTDPPLTPPEGRTLQWAPRVHPQLIVDETPEAIFLLHPHQPRWALTNRPGLEMARRFDGSNTLQSIIETLAESCGIPASEVTPDILAFVEQLHDANLLEDDPLPPVRTVVRHQEPHRLTIYLTEECNLRCKHCFVVEGRMPAPRLAAEDVRRIIDEHLERHPRALVAFTGGEPFLRPDCLELLEYAAARTTEVSLNTNGHLVDAAIAHRIAAINVFVQLSLDGPDPVLHDFIRGPGSFAKVRRALDLLCNAGMASRVRTATTLTRCTVQHVRQLVEDIGQRHIHELRFLILNRTKAAHTNWEQIAPDPAELLEIYRYLLLDLPFRNPPLRTRVQGDFPGFVPHPAPDSGHWCPMGRTTIIDSQGNSYACPMMLVPEFRTGHVHDAPLAALQQGETPRALRTQMLSRPTVLPECRACAWRNFCQGGCQAFTQIRTGSPWVMDEFCDFRRELYRQYALRRPRQAQAPPSCG
jgi:radical SAM protein with 4Fe4S-binding SPASM domain